MSEQSCQAPACLNSVLLKNGQLLTLRKPTPADAAAIVAYLNQVGGESDNLLFGKDEFHLTVDQEKAFLEKFGHDGNALMILGLVDDIVVSIAQISSPARRRIAHNSEIGLSVRKDFWRLGVGSALLEELLHFARCHPRIRNVSLAVKASNTGAIRLYEKFGFHQVGCHENYFWVNGQYDDDYLMDKDLGSKYPK